MSPNDDGISKLKTFPNLALIVALQNEDDDRTGYSIDEQQQHNQLPSIKISKLERESIQFFLAGVTPLLLLSRLPLFGEHCADFTWVVLYFKVLIAVYVTYHAIAVVKSKEYFPALSENQ